MNTIITKGASPLTKCTITTLSRVLAGLFLVAIVLVRGAQVTNASGEVVANGGFESGQSPWREATTPSQQLVASGTAHSGTMATKLCGVNSCNHEIWQVVSIPASFTSLTLTYWYNIQTQETSTACNDTFRSAIRTTMGIAITIPQHLCNTSKTNGWVQESVDVTSALQSYAGKQVEVYFQATTNASAPTTTYVDDVSLVTGTALSASTTSSDVYLGVSISGVPASMTALQTFEQHAHKHMAIISFWRTMGGQQSTLYDLWFQNVFAHNSVPMITWLPKNSDNGTSYSLTAIASGQYDSTITSWAQKLKSYGHVIFIRWAPEMNGSWNPWGQQPSAYIAAWRHIHNIFVSNGATNVRWVWCPNTQWNSTTAFTQYYPGDSYVDWVGLDSYNMPKNGAWYWFSNLFSIGNSYQVLTALTTKPVIIAETSSAEAYLWSSPPPYTKAQWITNAFGTGIPSMPRIHAVVWMEDNLTATEGCCNWSIESSYAAQSAFAQAVAPSTYLTTYP